MKLGFYSGEEEMEFSSFSDDTERAIKSWQASIEVREDGIMKGELLEKLFGEAGEENSIVTEEKEKTTKKIVMRLQCQSCKHVSQHAIKCFVQYQDGIKLWCLEMRHIHLGNVSRYNYNYVYS